MDRDESRRTIQHEANCMHLASPERPTCRPAAQAKTRGHRFLWPWLTFVACLSLAFASASHASEQKPLSRDDVAWLQRIGFGVDSASVARYRELGRARYLDEQLSPRPDNLPAPVSAMLDGYDVNTTPAPQLQAIYRDQRRQLKDATSDSDKAAAKKALQMYRRKIHQQDAQIALMHAIYGSNQLQEQMDWFWLNHFSIYAAKGRVALVASDYLEHAIRPHAMGKFRDLVMATLKSPAMLEFLDNDKNVKGKTNENYARELMELHTLGVNAGYTQHDVQQLALILTGASFALRDNPLRQQRADSGIVREGLFAFMPGKHDFSDKTLLGHTIKGSGYAEIEQAVTLITRQPACARFISRQLAEYFVADQPPADLVAAMTRTFERSDGDIAAVLRTLFRSPKVTASRGRKFRDPAQFLIAAMRLAHDGNVVSNPTPLVRWLNDMGEPVFGRITPDGWPLDGASWSGSGQMSKRFDVARSIGSGRNRLFAADDDMPVVPGMRNITRVPQLDTPLFKATLEPYLSAATRAALAKAKSAAEWNTFLLASPDFNYR
jgi:uncharacterized protein (DUF1800 family)